MPRDAYSQLLGTNRRRLCFIRKRTRQDLSNEEEREFQRLMRAVKRYCKRRWPETWEPVKALGRSPYTLEGRMRIAVRRRRAQVRKRGNPC